MFLHSCSRNKMGALDTAWGRSIFCPDVWTAAVFKRNMIFVVQQSILFVVNAFVPPPEEDYLVGDLFA